MENLDYEIFCMRYFVRVRYHIDSPLRYSIAQNRIKVFYYYNDKNLFDVKQEASILKSFSKKQKLIPMAEALNR